MDIAKKLNVNVNYKNIIYYILFVFIILTCTVKNIRPLIIETLVV